MKVSGLIGVVVGGLSIALGATIEGSNVAAIINIPALFIVLGGTLGASMGGANFDAFKAIPKLYKKAFMPDPFDLADRVKELVGYAERARRDGLLALDEQLASVEDPYTRKGLQLVVDGTDPELVAEVLEAENDAMRKRHAMCVQPFDKAGGYAPTMGIIGTVFGLVHVLTNLSQPETLGPMISAAFIATLLGVASANVVYLPVSARLKGLSQEEMHFREMTLEGILAIQAGENPRFVNEKLMAYVPPSRRPTEEEAAAAASSGSAGAGADAEKAAA
jgi:chemotaxis protein MotA